MGNYVEAKEYCLEAIRIWESIGITSSLGRGYLTRAVIYRDRGKYQNAAPFFKKAIEIFKKLEEPDDYKNLTGAYFDYAWSLWFEGDIFEYDGNDAEAQRSYKLSKEYFDSARNLAEKYEVVSVLPGIVNQMSNIYWRLGLKEDARRMIKEAYELSKRYNDIRYQIDSLLGFAEFDSEDRKYEKIESYAKELKEKYEDQGYEFPLFYGRMKRIQAEAALSVQDLERAKLLYANGIAQISQHGGYGLYFLDRELTHLKRTMQENLPPEKISEWIKFFKDYWQNHAEKREAKFGKLISWCSTFNNQIRFNHVNN
jgi:tetratricopeptide (TPR) repeat protein